VVGFLLVIEDENTRSKLEELYYQYHKEMFYIAYNILKDYHEAQDIVQTAIIKISSYMDRIESIKCNKTRAFLVIIVRNISYNIYNQRKRRNTMPLDSIEEIVPEEDIGPELHMIRLDQAKEMARLLSNINKTYADILTLKYFYEYSNSEIAQLINMTEGNVRVKIHRAKQALKKECLKEGALDEANRYGYQTKK